MNCAEVETLEPLHVLALWLGICMVMFPVKYSNRSFLCQSNFMKIIKLLQNCDKSGRLQYFVVQATCCIQMVADYLRY